MNSLASAALSVGLVQINNTFSGQVYFPYSVGCLQSYVEATAKQSERFQFLDPVYKRMPVNDIVSKLETADVVGFSTYVWNINISLEVGRRLKELDQNVFVVFGGPQVPNHAEDFLRSNPFVDVVFHGESEPSFCAFLEAYPDTTWRAVPGISYISDDDEFVTNPLAPRLRDLSELPSPFLSGGFDKLMADNPEESWIGLWETNRGCPFRCAYCDWGSAVAAKVSKFEMDRLLKEADWFSQNKIEYIFVCDANFGMLQRDIEIVERIAANSKQTGFPQGFSVQNTKNATDRAYATQKILSDAGLNKGVALSIQTLSEDALRNIRRDNISLEMYFTLQKQFSRDKVETFSDIILGLPGETYESFVSGIDQLLEAGQLNRIQFNNCAILPNAEMANPQYREEFNIETVETDIINIHGKKIVLNDDVPEFQELVVSNYSLSREEWRKCRAVSWMTAFLIFDKLLILPLALSHVSLKKRYRDLIQLFMEVDKKAYPILGRIRDFFLQEAENIQKGGSEYTYSEEWLGIYWPADEYMFVQLNADNDLDNFYQEAGALLSKALSDDKDGGAELRPFHDAISLNQALINRPFATDDVSLEISYDIASFYDGLREGTQTELQDEPVEVRVHRSERGYDDFQDWCREIVWWGNKKGAYLHKYTSNPLKK